MKKNKYLIALLALFIMAALFIAACPGPEPTPSPGPGPDPSDNYNFVVTITGPSSAQSPFTAVQGTKLALTRTVTAKDGTSTAGISFTYTDSVASGGVTVNSAGTELTVAASATVGDHVFTVSGKKSGTEVAKTTFTVNVTLATWGISFAAGDPVKHGEDGASITYTLTAPNGDTTGTMFEISTTSGSTLVLTNNASRRRIDIARVPDTAAVGEHRFTVNVKKSGETKASGNFTISIVPRYTLTPGQTLYQINRNGTLNITYTLTLSDGSTPTNITVGCNCTTDYDACELIKGVGGANWITDDDKDGTIVIVVPGDVEIDKVHGIAMHAEDENYKELADCSFNIKIIN